jgi:hypothetical protein
VATSTRAVHGFLLFEAVHRKSGCYRQEE